MFSDLILTISPYGRLFFFFLSVEHLNFLPMFVTLVGDRKLLLWELQRLILTLLVRAPAPNLGMAHPMHASGTEKSEAN